MKTLRSQRTKERGTVIFVVLMVLTVLSAIGVFAARAAGLNQRTSGYLRQSTEVGYVADVGILAARYELNTTSSLRYDPSPSAAPCQADLEASKVGTRCRKTGCAQMSSFLQTFSGSSSLYFDNAFYDTLNCNGSASTNITGSAVPRPQFFIEVSDRFNLGPIQGDEINVTRAKFQVVVNSTAFVIPVRPGAASSTEESQARSVRVSRAIVTFPDAVQSSNVQMN